MGLTITLWIAEPSGAIIVIKASAQRIGEVLDGVESLTRGSIRRPFLPLQRLGSTRTLTIRIQIR